MTYTHDDDLWLARRLELPRGSFGHGNTYLTAPTPSSDYAVLEAMQKWCGGEAIEGWEQRLEQWGRFEGEINRMFGTAGCHGLIAAYRVGDYARAAYAALKETNDD